MSAACEIEGCEHPARSRGLCTGHYDRLRRHGDPLAFPRADVGAAAPGHPEYATERFLSRFWGKVDKTSECWIWTGSLSSYGYGGIATFGKRGKRLKAHRVAYELLVGPIPDDLTIDHLCRNRACVNPEHMETVTRGENSRRGDGIDRAAELKRSKPDCPNGHLYTPENTYLLRGRRHCRICRKSATDAYRARRRDALEAAIDRSGT